MNLGKRQDEPRARTAATDERTERAPEDAARGEQTGRGQLSIGALSRSTGIPVETLRTWERRYGYPVPERTSSGQRVYPLASVARLRRIGEALAHGHRAREVVTASDDALRALLATSPAFVPFPPERSPHPDESGAADSELLGAVRAFDAAGLTRRLQAEWARRGPLDFLEGCLVPLIREVGAAWATGRLEVRHEHFMSERVNDLLRTLRLPFEERAGGPLVILTSLPGESHALGLHMAALVLALNRCRVLLLGVETPLAELVQLVRELRARAVGISVSSATSGAATTRRLRLLRDQLPRRTALLVGGGGAPRLDQGVTSMTRLPELDAWARQLADGAS